MRATDAETSAGLSPAARRGRGGDGNPGEARGGQDEHRHRVRRRKPRRGSAGLSYSIPSVCGTGCGRVLTAGRVRGCPFAVLGGAHGDLPLEPNAGSVIADALAESGQSFVLDLSEFSKTQQRHFVADFAQRLYARKGRDRTPILLVLEEADEFAPQRVSSRDAPMVGAISLIVKRGRSRGLGIDVHHAALSVAEQGRARSGRRADRDAHASGRAMWRRSRAGSSISRPTDSMRCCRRWQALRPARHGCGTPSAACSGG